MTLIAAEQDDAALLEAEDRAIAEAANPNTTTDTPLDDLVRLLNDDAPPVHGEGES